MAGGRRPRRTRPQITITLPAPLLAELETAAAAAPPGRYHSVSGQVVQLWERASCVEIARRSAVTTQLMLLDAAVRRLRELLTLPESIEMLNQIAKTSAETARLMQRR